MGFGFEALGSFASGFGSGLGAEVPFCFLVRLMVYYFKSKKLTSAGGFESAIADRI